MRSFLLPLLAELVLASKSASDERYEVFEKLAGIPQSWVLKEGRDVDHNLAFKLRIHLKNQNIDAFQQSVLDASTPSHPSYGQHLDQVAINNMIAPTTDAYTLVSEWLETHNLTSKTTIENDWVVVHGTIANVEELLQTEYQLFENTETGKMTARTLKYSLPAALHDHVDMIAPTIKFSTPSAHTSTLHETIAVPVSALSASAVHDGLDAASCNLTITPDCLKSLYNFKHFRASRRNGNQLALTGFLEQYAQHDDLKQFLQTYDPDTFTSDPEGFDFEESFINGGLNLQDNDSGPQSQGEANLDIQYGIGVAYPTKTYYTSTAGRPPENTDYEVDNEPYLEFLTALLAQEKIPQTISISYGDAEWTVPESYAHTVCNLFAQIAARGVSVLVSSGDGGSGSNCATAHPGTLSYNPIFPGGCPWVTAVGATRYVLPEQAVSFSGGGFSNLFPRPEWQNTAVTKYLENEADPAYTQYFNLTGRAYPDISAQGVRFHVFVNGTDVLESGTSASAPAFAGIVALLNSDRISNGLAPLGFLNPWLYSEEVASTFTDIVLGKSSGCTAIPGSGFPAVTGWDPVTGWGTPDFKKLRFASTGISS
jgi:tripeptidyl-peptidase-1